VTAKRAVVITASTRAAAGVYSDRSGPILVAGLRELGFEVSDAIIVPDGLDVEAALRAAIADGAQVIITSGGTGISPSDRTPDITSSLLDMELPGIAEALRANAVNSGIAMGMLSRGVAGVAGRSIVINVPGSTGAAADAIETLKPMLMHAVDQLSGESLDHP